MYGVIGTVVHLFDAKEGEGSWDFPKFMSPTSYVRVTSDTILLFLRRNEKKWTLIPLMIGASVPFCGVSSGA